MPHAEWSTTLLHTSWTISLWEVAPCKSHKCWASELDDTSKCRTHQLHPCSSPNTANVCLCDVKHLHIIPDCPRKSDKSSRCLERGVRALHKVVQIQNPRGDMAGDTAQAHSMVLGALSRALGVSIMATSYENSLPFRDTRYCWWWTMSLLWCSCNQAERFLFLVEFL